MKLISSKDNPQIKAAVKIRSGKVRDRIFVEGKRLSEEALGSGIPVRAAFFSRSFLESGQERDLTQTFSRGSVAAFELSDSVFRVISDTPSPQGVALVCERPVHRLDDIMPKTGEVPLILFLEGISNPGNLGAVIRTAEAAGATGVITSVGSVDAFGPAVLRGSMGASFRLPVVERTGVAEACEWAKRKGIKVIATAANSDAIYTEADLTGPSMLVLGSEAHGFGDAVIERAAETIGIPMAKGVESLNLAVSAGIILFEARRQRDLHA